MQPFDIKLSYNEKPWITVPLEIGSDEIGDADEPEYFIADDIVEIFRKLGFPDPEPIPLMPLHHQIAQKSTSFQRKSKNDTRELFGT